MKTAVSGIMLTLLLISIMSLAIDIKPAKSEWTGTVYIRAEGSIEPSDAPLQRDGDTYTLTGNITSDTDGIVVERSNIIVDGAGFTLQGTGSGYGFNLTSVSNVTIKNINIVGFREGVGCYLSSRIVLLGNNIVSNYYGLFFSAWSNHCSIIGNNVMFNFHGIYFGFYSDDNNVIGNNITNNGSLDSISFNVGLIGASNNNILGNNITNSRYGVILTVDPAAPTLTPNNNTIAGNTIKNNKYGVMLDLYAGGITDNKFYHNNLLNNTEYNAIITPSFTSVWDNGIEGNYWSDYNGIDSDLDGVGDTPYFIDENNQDNYPLMGMFSSFNTSLGYNVNVISNSTIEDFEYSELNNTIVMHVSNTTSDQTFGFVRICIPHALMNDTYKVMINGTEPYYVNYTLYDNGTHRWIYFSYQHSTLEIIIVPEFSSPLILPLFIIATSLAVLVYKRKHINNNRG